MPTPFDRFLEVYQQISLSFGVVDIYFDDSTDVRRGGRLHVSHESGQVFREQRSGWWGFVVAPPPFTTWLRSARNRGRYRQAAEEKFGRVFRK